MINKVQKIREEVEKLKSNLIHGACSSQIAMETRCKEEAYNEVLSILDTMQENPVSEDLEGASKNYALNNTPWDDCKDEIQESFKAGAKWQKTKDESTTEDLGEYINELSKQFSEVSFAKLSRIAVRVAKWQKEQFEKERLKHCDELTDEQAQIESDFVVNHLKKNNRTPTFIDAIEYGMRLQKKQMMAKAVNGYVIKDVEEGNGDFLLSADYLPKSMGLKDQQRVKVIVIKED